MDKGQAGRIQEWFHEYVQSYLSNSEEHQRNIQLKLDHCLRVAKECHALASHLQLDTSDQKLTEIIGLLHDVGRFEQVTRYSTFMDSKSEDHALLGVRILSENPVLNVLDDSEISLIIRSVTAHNQLTIPDGYNSKEIFYSQILRDADKLDVWHVVIDYYTSSKESNETLVLDLTEKEEVSTAVIQDFLEGKMVRKSVMQTVNDFKMLQMSWVFDINFSYTCQQILDRKYLESLRSVLPDSPAIDQITEMALKTVRDKLQE